MITLTSDMSRESTYECSRVQLVALQTVSGGNLILILRNDGWGIYTALDGTNFPRISVALAIAYHNRTMTVSVHTT